MGLTILAGRAQAAPISRNRAFCLLIDIPTRIAPIANSILVREVPRHWERARMFGRVLRCHTELEAQEALSILWAGVEQGQWINVVYDHYDPGPDDIPYHEWIRGVKRTELDRRGIPETCLPEIQDPSLASMSDDEWLARGPR